MKKNDPSSYFLSAACILEEFRDSFMKRTCNGPIMKKQWHGLVFSATLRLDVPNFWRFYIDEKMDPKLLV